MIKQPKPYLHQHGVLWAISKVTKIRDQGMELGVFVLRFKVCVRGVVLKIRRFLGWNVGKRSQNNAFYKADQIRCVLNRAP